MLFIFGQSLSIGRYSVRIAACCLSPPPVPTSWLPIWVYDHRHRWPYPYRHAELAPNLSHRMRATSSAKGKIGRA